MQERGWLIVCFKSRKLSMRLKQGQMAQEHQQQRQPRPCVIKLPFVIVDTR